MIHFDTSIVLLSAGRCLAFLFQLLRSWAKRRFLLFISSIIKQSAWLYKGNYFYNSSYSNNEFVPNIIQDQHAVFIFSFPTSLLPNLKIYRNEEIQRDSSLEQHFASTRFWYIPNMPIHTRTNKEGIYNSIQTFAMK